MGLLINTVISEFYTEVHNVVGINRMMSRFINNSIFTTLCHIHALCNLRYRMYSTIYFCTTSLYAYGWIESKIEKLKIWIVYWWCDFITKTSLCQYFNKKYIRICWPSNLWKDLSVLLVSKPTFHKYTHCK